LRNLQRKTVVSNRYGCFYRAQSNSTVTLHFEDHLLSITISSYCPCLLLFASFASASDRPSVSFIFSSVALFNGIIE